MIFEGDNIETVVKTFAEVYSLSDHKQKKLLDIVKRQMTNVLVNIGEADEEEEGTNTN